MFSKEGFFLLFLSSTLMIYESYVACKHSNIRISPALSPNQNAIRRRYDASPHTPTYTLYICICKLTVSSAILNILLIQIQIQIFESNVPGLSPNQSAIRRRCDASPHTPSPPSDNRPAFKYSKFKD